MPSDGPTEFDPDAESRARPQALAEATIDRDRFDGAYLSGTPPWDIPGPQPALIGLADAGLVHGRVLDVGCGTGENALVLAARGYDVVGVDASRTAIDRATAKAVDRGLPVQFRVGDALALDQWGEWFDTVLDSGLFHVFSDADQARFIAGLQTVLRPGGRYHLLCFSEQATLPGPRRLTQAAIRARFADGWQVESITAAHFDLVGGLVGGAAWLASLRRS